MDTPAPGSGTPLPPDAMSPDRTGTLDAPPYVPHWHPGPTELPDGCQAILDWSPATDPNAPFNRSRVPLRPRAQRTELRASGRAGKGRVMSCAEFWNTDKNPPQGVQDHRYYAFGYWQYVDVLVFWAGVADKGLICPPNGHLTDAAHRNGVKVYGSVFFPPVHGAGGKPEWVTDFVQQLGTTGKCYPVADKLIEAAQYLGFDGWFINYETPTDAETEAALRATLAYARNRSEIEFAWYEAFRYELADSGPNRNEFYLQDAGRRVCDSVFIDYGWGKEHIDRSITTAAKIKRSKYDVHYGLELVRKVPENPGLLELVCPAGAEHRGGLALYAAHTVSNQPKEPKEAWLGHFYRAEADFWTGPCHDPGDDGWPGIAARVAEHTPVLGLPFVTHFNTGHGTSYHHAGTKVGDSGWANLSLQDVLPTYRWITRCTGNSRMHAALCFDQAWEGGSCLRLTGALAPGFHAAVRLYQTRLDVAAGTKVTVRARTPSAADFEFAALIALDKEPTELVCLPLATTDTGGWKTYTADLSGYAGKKLVQLGLRLRLASSAKTDLAYDIRVGQLAVHTGAFTAPPAPTNLTVDHSTTLGDTRRALRLSWKAPTGADAIHHYALHRGTGSTLVHLGGTPNTVYYLSRLDRNNDTKTTLTLTSVGPDGTHSTTAATAVVAW